MGEQFRPRVGQRVHFRERDGLAEAGADRQAGKGRVVLAITSPAYVIQDEEGRLFVVPIDSCEFAPVG